MSLTDTCVGGWVSAGLWEVHGSRRLWLSQRINPLMDSKLDGIVGGSGNWPRWSTWDRPVQGMLSLPVYGLGWLSWSTMMGIVVLCHTLPLLWGSAQLHRAIICSCSLLARIQALHQGPSTLWVDVKSSQPHSPDAALADRHSVAVPWLHSSLAGFMVGTVFLCDVGWSIFLAKTCFPSWLPLSVPSAGKSQLSPGLWPASEDAFGSVISLALALRQKTNLWNSPPWCSLPHNVHGIGSILQNLGLYRV